MCLLDVSCKSLEVSLEVSLDCTARFARADLSPAGGWGGSFFLDSVSFRAPLISEATTSIL